MLKNTLILLLLGAFGLGISGQATAQTATGSDTTKKDERPLLERAKDWKIEKRQRIKAELNRIRERFPAAFDRNERLVAKIEARIAEFDARSISTTVAKAKIAEAKTLIAEAKAHYEALKTKIETAGTQLTGDQAKPLAIIEEVRNSIKNLVEKIKMAHEKVREAVKALKDARLEAKDNATASTTAN